MTAHLTACWEEFCGRYTGQKVTNRLIHEIMEEVPKANKLRFVGQHEMCDDMYWYHRITFVYNEERVITSIFQG